MCDNLLLFKGRIVIPECLQKGTLEKIHNGHQGVERCRMMSNESQIFGLVAGDISAPVADDSAMPSLQ